MVNKNTNLLDSEAEKQRLIFSMLPFQLSIRATPEGKGLLKKMSKDLPKKHYRQKIHFAQIFNDLATTQAYPQNIDMHDIHLEPGEMSSHPYEYLLRSLGTETAVELLKHAKVVDNSLNRKLSNQVIIDLKSYLSESFSYESNELDIGISAEGFYHYLVIGFIAHIDACVHHAAYSEIIAPISLGWLFMKKRDWKKWQYDIKSKRYVLINKNGSPFTVPSRSFIELLQTILYWQVYKEMPTGLYSIDKKITRKEFDDPDGKLENFIRRKKEGKWITLEELYWLAGVRDYPKHEPSKVLVSWQESVIKYIKTENINEMGGIPPVVA